jgi:hypothetical protein
MTDVSDKTTATTRCSTTRATVAVRSGLVPRLDQIRNQRNGSFAIDERLQSSNSTVHDLHQARQ